MADAPQDQADRKAEHRASRLRETRRQIILLEIQTHELRAEHARLEAEGEEEAAERLTEQLRRHEAELAANLVDSFPDLFAYRQRLGEATLPSSLGPNPRGPGLVSEFSPGRLKERCSNGLSQDEEIEPLRFDLPQEKTNHKRLNEKRKRARRRAMPAWVVSIATHGLLLLTLGAASFATLQDERFFLLASAAEDESFDDFAEISIEAPDLEELELEEITEELGPIELAQSLDAEIETPWDSVALGAEAVGPSALDALPTDMTGLMTGDLGGGAPDGSVGAGKKPGGGVPASSQFFGARSRGERFVFVVDNSGSMVDGRMETTFLELLRSVGSMKPQQEFHVLFYSDQVYPMFFPTQEDKLLPATRENRARLERWLATVEMCKGDCLSEAMDYAASLEPQVVYLLTDGGFLYRTSRGRLTKTRKLTYLTEETAQWPFVVHTLGMTVRDRNAAGGLALIAQSHGGAFHPVAVNPAAAQLARQHVIRYNQSPGPVWGSKVRSGW
jgi:hypothetical protein